MKRIMLLLISLLGIASFANAEVLSTPNPQNPNNMTMPDMGKKPPSIQSAPGTNTIPDNSGINNNGLNNQTTPSSDGINPNPDTGTLNNNPGTDSMGGAGSSGAP